NNTTTVNRVSFNGGNGGITARPTAAEERVAHLQHTPPTSVQEQHVREASSNRELRASVNQGKPAIAATAKPAEFRGRGVVAARQAGAPYKAPEKNAAQGENARAGRAENNAAARNEKPAANPRAENANRPENRANAQRPNNPNNKAENRPENANRPENRA